MANVTNDIPLAGMGQDGRRFHMPVDGGTKIYAGAMVSQLIATGMLVHTTTAGAGPCIGKATHTIDNGAGADGAERCMIETDRIYLLSNGAGGDAFSDASLIGSPVYAFDDHTGYDNNGANTLQQCGTFQGMEADGRIRVLITTGLGAAGGVDPVPQNIQYGTGTLAAGVLAVTGVTITSTSVIICQRKTEAGTDGDEIRVPAADRTVGALGTGAFTARAFLDGAAATSDTSTFDWIIVG